MLQVTPLLRETILRVVERSGLDSREPRDAHLMAVLVDEIDTPPVEPLELPLPQDPRALPVAQHILAAPAEARTNDTVKNLALGVELTEKELVNVLEQQGVRNINSLNQAFDANLHNAIQEVENTAVPAGTVVQVFQDGYLIHDRLLRPAMVVVSRGGPKRESAAPTANSGGINTSA